MAAFQAKGIRLTPADIESINTGKLSA